MGLSKGKFAAILLVIMLVVFGVSRLLSSGSAEAPEEPSETPGVVQPTDEPTETQEPVEEPTQTPVEEPTVNDTSIGKALQSLSLEDEGFKAFEKLPNKEIIELSDAAAYGALEYMTYEKGETPEQRSKRIKKYIHSQSSLITDDMMSFGVITTAHSVINTTELLGANDKSAAYLVGMDVSLQFIASDEDPLSSVTTTRTVYHVLVQKTDEGWKITDMEEVN